jgi:hypothetical protein
MMGMNLVLLLVLGNFACAAVIPLVAMAST